MSMRFPLSLALIGLVPLVAQEREPAAGLVAVHQARLDAANGIVVLNVAAHPDDESSRTNMLLRRKYGMHVVQVYSTYGDGGQNAIGREIGPELAKIRVRETLRAAAMSGAEVRWLGMPDFGFSKTRAETLRIWGADELKARMRDVFDEVDPDVVLTNHSLDRGHGHHRASIWAAIEVLKERAAKGRYVPWLYARCGVDSAQLNFETGALDPARGQTYARMAWNAWTQHESQGPWGAHDPLRVGRDHWRVVYPEGVSDEHAADLTRWRSRRGGGGPQNLPADFGSVPREQQLAQVLAAIEAEEGRLERLPADDGLRARRSAARLAALRRLYLALSMVRAEVWLDREEVPRGGLGKGYVVLHGHDRVEEIVVRCGAHVGRAVTRPIRQTPFDDRPRKSPRRAAPLPGRFEFAFDCSVGADDDLPRGPEPSFARVQVSFTLDGRRFVIAEDLPYTPVAPIAMTFEREAVLVPNGQQSTRVLSVSVHNHTGANIEGAVQLQMGPGIRATATPSRLALSEEQREARILVRATIDAAAMTRDSGLTIGFADARVRLPLRMLDVSVPPGLNVGLVRGPEDSTERTLADLGIPFTSLDRDALVSTRLERFSVVLLDIRAYHHRPELAEVRDRLQQYCRSGGRIVAMYHKPREWNERQGHPLLAPFALTVGNERVTEEHAPVTILAPQHRLMSQPHRIVAADFEGWVQERGLNFPKAWDAAWLPMLAMKDSGDANPHQGALLYTSYGKGDFVYCSLSLYRQLRRGNPGAVRLLVNLLSR
ncbi:MAG TPA: PIG-L family deacetylase [bacterium]|nr:PIG-L family deacetylase [bacterium]